MQKSLHDYFKLNSSPTGPVSKVILATAISYANKKVMAVLKSGKDKSGVKERGPTRNILERKELELETM